MDVGYLIASAGQGEDILSALPPLVCNQILVFFIILLSDFLSVMPLQISMDPILLPLLEARTSSNRPSMEVHPEQVAAECPSNYSALRKTLR
jgi:hypothetical protein